ncbi:MAG TPA: RHS repeat-associated core domain-containing protein [Streptosporangiaceae bacterium]|nr:RHS repeat-associated core domain-containing protein [Streptosporangiaceae bacterium]
MTGCCAATRSAPPCTATARWSSGTGTWPGDNGFVGGTQDPTGLTHLGARDYDPETGRFLSVDPLIDLNDPQQFNAYANNTPTLSDPDGERPVGDSIHDTWNYNDYKNKGSGFRPGTRPRYTPPTTDNPGHGFGTYPKVRHIDTTATVDYAEIAARQAAQAAAIRAKQARADTCHGLLGWECPDLCGRAGDRF